MELQEVVKYDIQKGLVEEIKKSKGFKVSDFKNKNEIQQLDEKLKIARDYRLAIEEQRKALKQPYLDKGREIDNIAKQLQAETLPIENELKAEKQRIDDLIQAEKDRIENELKARLDKRVQELKNNGIQFDGHFYSISNISVDVNTIKNLDEKDYLILLSKVKLAKEKIDAENAERLAKEKAERERIAREQAELKAEQEKIRKEREAIELERRELQRMKDEAEQRERLEREKVERQKAELKAKEEQELKAQKQPATNENEIVKGYLKEFAKSLESLPRVENKGLQKDLKEFKENVATEMLKLFAKLDTNSNE